MMRWCSLIIAGGLLVLGLDPAPSVAKEAATKGKNCRMEQQCRWENFKKICTWVKVCR